jgi:5-methyltetrahydropteroyltriglutamate--homocysteine methyltransferase
MDKPRKDGTVKRSDDRILTTHVGSLPRQPGMAATLYARETGGAHDRAALARGIKDSVSDVVRRQLEIGIDIVNDGEHSKFNFITYGRMRLGGLEPNPKPVAMMGDSRDSRAFPATYSEMSAMNAARSPEVAGRRKMPTMSTVSKGPVTYVGQADVAGDIANLKEALQSEAAQGRKPEDVFMTAISPNNLEFYHRNGFYPTDEQHLEALANAMNIEYRAIVDAGFVLQVDDPRMATHYNRTPDASIEECRTFIAQHVEAVNLALKGIPRERVRFHTCYSVNVAPRVHDMELRHYLDLMLRINAQAFSFEAANPRHEHEWAVWKDAKLPDDIILIPGVVSHCVHLVEHPELVAQRIERYACIVGRDNVLASNDCGFATSAAGDEVNTEVAWAKLEALAEGARIASARLWPRSAAA